MSKGERVAIGGERGSGGETLRLIDSATLFGDAQEIGIVHGGEIYRLRITRLGKLILNK